MLPGSVRKALLQMHDNEMEAAIFAADRIAAVSLPFSKSLCATIPQIISQMKGISPACHVLPRNHATIGLVFF